MIQDMVLVMVMLSISYLRYRIWWWLWQCYLYPIYDTGYGAGFGSVIYTLPGELLAPEDKSMGGAAAESSRMVVEAMVSKV